MKKIKRLCFSLILLLVFLCPCYSVVKASATLDIELPPYYFEFGFSQSGDSLVDIPQNTVKISRSNESNISTEEFFYYVSTDPFYVYCKVTTKNALKLIIDAPSEGLKNVKGNLSFVVPSSPEADAIYIQGGENLVKEFSPGLYTYSRKCYAVFDMKNAKSGEKYSANITLRIVSE